MLLLYIDESGQLTQGQLFVVGGLVIDVADIEAMRGLVETSVADVIDEQNRHYELHADWLRTGRGPWRKVPQDVRRALVRNLTQMLSAFRPEEGRRYSLLAIARAPGAVPGADPLERSFEELFLKFRSMLDDIHRETGSAEYGLVIADKAKYETILQPLVTGWREAGTRFGRLRGVVEVPLFVDSAATRLLQMADFVSNAVYSYYSGGSQEELGMLLPAFHSSEGVMHGLMHLVPNHRGCPCPACVSRMIRNRVRAERGRRIRGQLELLERLPPEDP